MNTLDELSLRGGGTVAAAAAVADQFTDAVKWNDFLQSKATNTLKAYEADLDRFSNFMRSIGVLYSPDGSEYMAKKSAWDDITPGLVVAFREWMMKQGYAVATVNRSLAAVKGFARLAGKNQSEQIITEIRPDGVEFQRKVVTFLSDAKGYGHKAARNNDERRAKEGIKTRRGYKKPNKGVILTEEQAAQLLNRPQTPQGRRDAVLMAILLDHGLRCGEVALLEVERFDLQRGQFTFYRPKADKWATDKFQDNLKTAMEAYKPYMPASGFLLRPTLKSDQFSASDDPKRQQAAQRSRERYYEKRDEPMPEAKRKVSERMTERSITARVRELGKEIGIPNLSAHDCRHYWTTLALNNGTHPRAVQLAGGWNSSAMVMQYWNETQISNEGVKLKSKV